MKKTILLIVALTIGGATFAQESKKANGNVTIDKDGNYVAISATKTVKKDSVLNVPYIDADSVKHTIHVGARGGLYVWKTRKSGKSKGLPYKFYLKVAVKKD